MNETLNYYNAHAMEFSQETVSVDFSSNQNRFLEKLPREACILDFGCGSGRDTRYFLEQGYTVDAIDGSEELCKLAAEYTGRPVKCMRFEELDDVEKYDGIWACSSILHLPKTMLQDVFLRMSQALRKDGIIYTSFKYGNFEGMRNGRFFTDFTIEAFREFIKCIDTLMIEEMWITGDVRTGREEEQWLNLILRENL